MAFYEHVIIVKQDLSESQVDKLIDELSQIVTANEGKVEKVERWGMRTFAYPIKKNNRGYYVMLNLDAPAKAIHALEEKERYEAAILRKLSIKVKALNEEDSAQMSMGDVYGRRSSGGGGGKR